MIFRNDIPDTSKLSIKILTEQVPDTTCSLANEYFVKLWSSSMEKGHARFSSHGTCQ